ncbi:MAG TPA: phosphoribosylanthranilate isomerase [Acetobacteraceae bacterium]
MTTRVKICGINSPVALDAAADAGADWIGYVFFPPSPRAVTPAQAAALDRHRRGPARVGLFVDPRDEDVAEVLAALPLDVLQVHASAERAAALRYLFNVPVWHVAGVGTAADLPASAPGVDGLLLDAKAPPGATRPGGNAVAFDWSLLHGWAAPLPWLLAGGLIPDTVAEAVRVSGAPAVDVSSGVERTRGVKDAELIRAFVQAAKSTPSA